MQARLISAAERQEFNRFVAWGPKGHILQSYEWGEIKAQTGWEPLRLVVEDQGQIVAAVSVLQRRIPVLGRTIFYAPRGPVADIHNPAVFDFLLAELRRLAKQQGAVFLKIDPDIPAADPDWQQYLTSRGFRPAAKGAGFEGVQPRFVFRLDLTPDVQTIFANFQQKTRYNIRLAEKKGVEVTSDSRKEDLPEFYRVLKETTERDNFLVRSYDYFLDLWEHLVVPGYAKLFLARYNGQIIAGTLAFIFGPNAWYIYGASSNSYRNVMPNYLLQWRMICWAKENNCTMYDFRGVPGHLTEDNPLYGLYRFKKGFSGDYTEFIAEHDLVYNPALYWLWTTGEPLYQRNIRRLIALKKKLKGR